MDRNSDQEVNESGNKSSVSSASISSSPHIPTRPRRLGPVWMLDSGFNGHQQPGHRQNSGAEQHQFNSPRCTVVAAPPSLPSTAEPSQQASASFHPQASIPAAAAGTSNLANKKPYCSPTTTTRPTSLLGDPPISYPSSAPPPQQQQQRQHPTSFAYSGAINPAATQYPASFLHTSLNPAAPQASYTAAPWSHYPARPLAQPTQSGFPTNPHPSIDFRAPLTMAATHGYEWSPLLQ